jgi:metallo-beta-lactamase family protein
MNWKIFSIVVKGGRLTDFPVFLDSPLAGRITEVYRDLKPWWDKEALNKLARGRRPLAFAGLHRVDSHDDHLRLVDSLSRSGQPALVVAGSGMCTGGRIVNYLQRMLGDPRHCVLFVGYQASRHTGTRHPALWAAGWLCIS